MQAVGSRALKPGLESFEHLDISGTKKDLFEQFIWLHGLSEFVFVKSTNSASALAPFTLLPLMEIAHYILCISYALNLVSCSGELAGMSHYGKRTSLMSTYFKQIYF